VYEDARSGLVVFLAHCILNQNTRARGVARRRGPFEEVVVLLAEKGIGVVQLPCPELEFFQEIREPSAKDALDTPEYRAFCRELASRAVDLLNLLLKQKMRVIGIIGVEHSPSCAVTEVPLSSADLYKYSEGMGIFFEELSQALRESKLNVRFVGLYSASNKAETNVERLRTLLEEA